MKKHYRVRNTKDFTRIIHQGTALKSNALVLYYTCNTEHLRVGIAVSKKVGNAVTRNKIKRQLRAIFTHYTRRLKNRDIVVVVRKNYLDHSYEQITTLVDQLLDKMEKNINEEEK